MTSSPRHAPKNAADNMLPPFHDDVTETNFPEGGLAAWCTVIGVFLVQFCGLGYTNTFGVYQAYYAKEYLQNETSSAISWIGGLATFLVPAMGPICGRLFDGGYFYHVSITGSVLQSLALFMLSLVKPGQYYQVFLSQGLMSGIGQGLMFVPSFAVLSHHFKRREEVMMSIVVSGTALGATIHTVMLNKLFNSSVGFRTTVQISAAFVSALLFLACTLMRTRYSAIPRKQVRVHFWRAAKKNFTEMPALLIIIGFMFFQAAFVYPFFYFQLDATTHGLSASFIFLSLIIVHIGSFLGRFAAGLMLPFIGVIDLTIITTFSCGVVFIGMIWLASPASVVALGFLFGLLSGMVIAMMAPMLGLTSDPEELGVRLGVGFAITGIGGLVGSPICGAILTRHYIWLAPALFCGISSFAAGALFAGARYLFLRGGTRSVVQYTTRDEDIEEVKGGASEKKEIVVV